MKSWEMLIVSLILEVLSKVESDKDMRKVYDKLATFGYFVSVICIALEFLK